MEEVLMGKSLFIKTVFSIESYAGVAFREGV
jgi:hypothetical protein